MANQAKDCIRETEQFIYILFCISVLIVILDEELQGVLHVHCTVLLESPVEVDKQQGHLPRPELL